MNNKCVFCGKKHSIPTVKSKSRSDGKFYLDTGNIMMLEDGENHRYYHYSVRFCPLCGREIKCGQ